MLKNFQNTKDEFSQGKKKPKNNVELLPLHGI